MKNKIFLIGLVIIIVLAIILGVGTIFFLKQRDNKISLIEDNVVIEYGESYNPTLEQLINLETFDYIDTQNVEIKSNIENEENREYPAVGIYEINVIYKDKVLKQSVEIKDTISPKLDIQESIELENGVDLSTIDFSQYITKSDLSEMKDYNIDLSTVDTNKSGEYNVKVSIEDIYGNASEKEFKIIIPELTELIEENSIEAESFTNNTTTSSSTPNNSNNNLKTTISTNNQTTTQVQQNGSQLETTKDTSSKTQSSETTSETLTKSDLGYWCVSGGTNHVAGDGENEHGYYASWDLAYSAFEEYVKGLDNAFHYKVSQCACGLYYFWVEEIK